MRRRSARYALRTSKGIRYVALGARGDLDDIAAHRALSRALTCAQGAASAIRWSTWASMSQSLAAWERAVLLSLCTCAAPRTCPILPLMPHQSATILDVRTPGRALVEITREVADWVEEQQVQTALLTLFIRHTSASLLIQENADADVQADLNRFLARLVPDGDPLFRHRDEGPDDMPAHVRAALTAVQLSVPVVSGRLALGTWQGIYVWEHRLRPHRRQVVLHLLGE